MKSVLLSSLSILLFSTAALAERSLSEKVCRSPKAQVLDCHISEICEKESGIERRVLDENFDKICKVLYQRFNAIDPIAEIEK